MLVLCPAEKTFCNAEQIACLRAFRFVSAPPLGGFFLCLNDVRDVQLGNVGDWVLGPRSEQLTLFCAAHVIVLGAHATEVTSYVASDLPALAFGCEFFADEVL